MSDNLDRKTSAEWIIKFNDDNGTCATIYDYKVSKKYLGPEGLDVEEIDDWHIGGPTDKANCLVKASVKGTCRCKKNRTRFFF